MRFPTVARNDARSISTGLVEFRHTTGDHMPKTRILFVFAVAVLIVVASQVLPVSIFADVTSFASATSANTKSRKCSETEQGQECWPQQMPSMLTEYLACSSEAAVRILSLAKALACTEALMVVKLSFIAGVDPETYRQMSTEEQIEINNRAYQAFSKWRDENPGLFNG